MTTVAAFTRPEVDIEWIGRRGHFSLEYKVHGFWSEPVKIYIRNERIYDGEIDARSWEFEVQNSSGGRDLKVEPDNKVAMTNFAHAILDAIELVKELEAQANELTHFLQVEMAERRAQAEIEQAKRQAAMDADPEIGEEGAKQLLIELREAAKLDDKHKVCLVMYQRGSDYTTTVVAENMGGNSMRYKATGYDKSTISRKELMGKIAKSSQRTRIEL